jgi:7-carboxy-7-deazaguanine synthase
VITGGEPMLFEPVEELSAILKSAGKVITIETAGTIDRSVACDLMSISPKLSNSCPGDAAGVGWGERHEDTRYQPQVLRSLIANYPYQLKFVVNPEAGHDIAEIKTILAEIGPVEPDRVLLMAEGTDSETLHRRQRALVGVCMVTGWRLTPRMHVDLFGNTRGT